VAQITLDGSTMSGQGDFCGQFFAQAVSVIPDYGGRNLDALHDDLRDLTEPLTIVWECSGDARTLLGQWFEKVLSVLRERDARDQPVTVLLR
jgi:RNAse (barnase) inhibitor barstar